MVWCHHHRPPSPLATLTYSVPGPGYDAGRAVPRQVDHPVVHNELRRKVGLIAGPVWKRSDTSSSRGSGRSDYWVVGISIYYLVVSIVYRSLDLADSLWVRVWRPGICRIGLFGPSYPVFSQVVSISNESHTKLAWDFHVIICKSPCNYVSLHVRIARLHTPSCYLEEWAPIHLIVLVSNKP